MTSYTFTHYIILMMTLHNMQCRPKLRVGSKSLQFNYQNIPCDLTKKMNTHTLCFFSLIRKKQAFEILKWAQGSKWRKQGTYNFNREIQLIFSRLWNTTFYIFMTVKYNFFIICIIFNQYFSVFHYFVYIVLFGILGSYLFLHIWENCNKNWENKY